MIVSIKIFFLMQIIMHYVFRKWDEIWPGYVLYRFTRMFMCVCFYASDSYITDTTCFYVFVFCTDWQWPTGWYTVLPREHRWTHAESNLMLLQSFTFLFAHTHWAMPLNLFLWFGFIVLCTLFKPHFPSAFCKPVHAKK